ncbi:hypothetical protein [Tenggerimyces flavus]|uniref:Uncharacterized protein n=1 Tax=Tenggerimyces flavus TaxID=1708749 RepID=A0ABV7YDP2_9ACTN|nr:hypothetical protein [Tenggerimyces flavus]MBM7783746.1 hypothetical protein [Tenggerimyces flavus]
MTPIRPSDLIEQLADECAEIDLVPLRDGRLFVHSDQAVAGELRRVAGELAEVVTQAAHRWGITVEEFPVVTLRSQPAWFDGRRGLVLQIASALYAQSPWDATALLDLPAAIRVLVVDLRIIESLDDGQGDVAAPGEFVLTGQQVCTMIDVVGRFAAAAAVNPAAAPTAGGR